MLFLSCSFALTTAGKEPLRQAKFSEIVNFVSVTDVEDLSERKAELNEVFSVPNLVKTGRRSRTELKAADETVIRLGANTTFSFSPDQRTIKLEEGSLLFHSPTGRGGGQIETATATATVIGTTIVAVVAPDGSFKILVLEGEAEVTFIDGSTRLLSAGQLAYIKASTGGEEPRASKVMYFDLGRMVDGSLLVGGFKKPLASYPKILASIREQKRSQAGKRKPVQSSKMAPPPDSSLSPNGINRKKEFPPIEKRSPSEDFFYPEFNNG